MQVKHLNPPCRYCANLGREVCQHRLAGRTSNGALKGFAVMDQKTHRKLAKAAIQKRWGSAHAPEPAARYVPIREAVVADIMTPAIANSYRRAINEFLYWLKAQKITLESMDEDDVAEELAIYGKHLAESYSPSHAQIKMSALRNFVKELAAHFVLA
jgi:hypothetical protein